MKDFIHRTWMPLTGAVSSLSFKTISDVVQSNPEIVDATQEVLATTTDHNMFWYFFVGLAGALGGLVIKILWGCTKRVFPKLKNIDK